MIAQVGERVLEGFDRRHVGAIAFHEQVVERIVHVRGELERVVVDAPDPRALHAELVFDLLSRSHDVHHAGHHDAQNLTEVACHLGSDARRIQPRTGHHG
jgi:hypothetical protein